MEVQEWEFATCCWFSTPGSSSGDPSGPSCCLGLRFRALFPWARESRAFLKSCLLFPNGMERAAVCWESPELAVVPPQPMSRGIHVHEGRTEPQLRLHQL